MDVKDLTRIRAVLDAHRRGLPMQEIARRLGISAVRVSQILREGRPGAGASERPRPPASD
jgi:transposase-like protein